MRFSRVWRSINRQHSARCSRSPSAASEREVVQRAAPQQEISGHHRRRPPPHQRSATLITLRALPMRWNRGQIQSRVLPVATGSPSSGSTPTQPGVPPHQSRRRRALAAGCFLLLPNGFCVLRATTHFVTFCPWADTPPPAGGLSTAPTSLCSSSICWIGAATAHPLVEAGEFLPGASERTSPYCLRDCVRCLTQLSSSSMSRPESRVQKQSCRISRHASACPWV